MKLKFNLNGRDCAVEADPSRTLLDVLRTDLGLTGTKYGCGVGECGSCTILIDGKAVCSCLTLIGQADGRTVETVEGLAQGEKLHPLQESFVESHAIQCGYCTPGMLMSAKAFLDQHPSPSEEEIRTAISGNLCRCTGYKQIVAAIQHAADKIKKSVSR